VFCDRAFADDVAKTNLAEILKRCGIENADEPLWLSQALIAELFETTPQNVAQHLRAILDSGELTAEATCKDYLQVQREGGRLVHRSVRHYNLDAILAVGYRVRSPRGTQFRIWARERLREYLIKGFVMDDERLKNPPVDGAHRRERRARGGTATPIFESPRASFQASS